MPMGATSTSGDLSSPCATSRKRAKRSARPSSWQRRHAARLLQAQALRNASGVPSAQLIPDCHPLSVINERAYAIVSMFGSMCLTSPCAEADDERLSSLASPAGLVTNEANAHAHLQDGRQATAQQPSRDALDQHPCRQSRSSASVHCSHLNAAHACAARPGEKWLHSFMSSYALPTMSG